MAHRKFICVILLGSALLALPRLAGAVAPGLTLNKTYGPPTVLVSIRGSGFGASEVVDLFFDTTDLVLAVTSETGAFLRSLQVSRSTAPGEHWITAVGRRSGLAAQKAFMVRTDWPQLSYGAQRTGQNALENTLNRTNVADLDLAWDAAAGLARVGKDGKESALPGGALRASVEPGDALILAWTAK